ncbi:8661_t:CDS:2 [Diversispora eburnea]|uniref:8661_t:CDS:1 n=1 Tax=Diversispora eburnea TaxID=1213867 RepID=A0A9N9A3I4_9GLOM|nr:8661_t:CDS:2 [Diversispora eburnea]
MKVFYSDVCLKHAPQNEILSGNFVEYLESPSRITLIKEHLSQFPEKFEICSHLDYGIEPILSIHDNDYIEYLKTAYIEWCKAGGDKKGVIPEAFFHKGILDSSKMNLKNIKSPFAKAGLYCFDLSCCITEDTWEATYESAQVCINIFYSQSNPLYVSFHGSNDYPYFTGDETEIGDGDGKGYNINISLNQETVDEEYLEKLKIVIRDKIIPYNADFLVVSLGVDTYKDDPIGGMQITTLGYKRIGNLIKSIGLPTLFIMEGGYHMETLKFNVYNVLSGFDEELR